MFFPQALVKCSLHARHCAESTGNVTVIMRSPRSSRADTPWWTPHAQYLFPHSADTHEHEDQVVELCASYW